MTLRRRLFVLIFGHLKENEVAFDVGWGTYLLLELGWDYFMAFGLVGRMPTLGFYVIAICCYGLGQLAKVALQDYRHGKWDRQTDK